MNWQAIPSLRTSVIAGCLRGGVYAQDALGVSLTGNDVSGFNTSGTPGFVVQPFYLKSYTAGVATDVENGINAGWAGILIDTGAGSNSISISNNYVHDGVCGDGIDIRGMNTGDISVQLEYNFVTRLVQCSSVSTIEGIGTQVTGTSGSGQLSSATPKQIMEVPAPTWIVCSLIRPKPAC